MEEEEEVHTLPMVQEISFPESVNTFDPSYQGFSNPSYVPLSFQLIIDWLIDWLNK